ncbi:MAG: hypothetical protein EBZ50_04750, partial [Alphaproteobacteria bacterium]|nr:hypothetical protein [Alphaproteobacteria bacterium]
ATAAPAASVAQTAPAEPRIDLTVPLIVNGAAKGEADVSVTMSGDGAMDAKTFLSAVDDQRDGQIDPRLCGRGLRNRSRRGGGRQVCC